MGFEKLNILWMCNYLMLQCVCIPVYYSYPSLHFSQRGSFFFLIFTTVLEVSIVLFQSSSRAGHQTFSGWLTSWNIPSFFICLEIFIGLSCSFPSHPSCCSLKHHGTGNSGCFPLGKRAAIVLHNPAFSFLCAVFSLVVFPYHRLWSYSFTTDGHGIFNVRTNLDTCRTHEGGSGTTKSAQELTRRDRKTVPYPIPLQGIEPRFFRLQ